MATRPPGELSVTAPHSGPGPGPGVQPQGPWRPIVAGGDPLDSHPLVGCTLTAAHRRVAATDPSHPAVVDATLSLTHGALVAAADDVADRLRAVLERCADGSDTRRPGVVDVDGDGTPVGTPTYLLGDHDAATVVALMAVSTAGATSLVLDHRAPAAYRADIVARHGRGPVVCTVAHLPEARRLAADPDAVVLVDPAGVAAGRTPGPLREDDDDRHPLTVSSTSGTSGVPKAVVHDHRNVVANAVRFAAVAGLDPGDRILVSLPFAFVASGTPTYAALLAGATAVVVDPVATGATGFVDRAREDDVTVVFLTAGLIDTLGRADPRPAPSVRLVVTGGDRLDATHLAALAAWFPTAGVLHRFNTSETLWATGLWVDTRRELPDGPVPIGWPVPWVDVDVHADELVVTGDHLALGYLNDPDRTADRFTPLPDGRRRYRTGDSVRRSDDGLLTHTGRLDTTTKIHGVLVDPHQVEASLAAIDGVRSAAVAVVEDAAGRPRLAGWVVAPGMTGRLVRRALSERLPAAFVPASITVVDALPLTSMGKMDRTALVRASEPVRTGSGGAPTSDLERLVAATIGDVLAISDLGRHDDLFVLGADSLDAVEIVTRLSTALRSTPEPVGRRSVEVPDLIDHPTPAALAGHLAGPSSSLEGHRHRRLRKVADGDPSRAPLILFSGGGGGRMAGMAQLARAVGGREAWVVLPRGFASRSRPDRTIEAQAATVADDIAAQWPQRPVALVGYSAGGVVAAEVGRRLAAVRTPPEAVVLINTLLVDDAERKFRSGRSRRQRNADRFTSAGRRVSPLRRVWWTARAVPGDAVERWRRLSAGVLPRSGRSQEQAFAALGRSALDRHRPGPLPLDVTLVRATVDDGPHARAPDDLHWAGVVTGTLRLVTVPGSHLELLRGASLPHTAAAVSTALNRSVDT